MSYLSSTKGNRSTRHTKIS